MDISAFTGSTGTWGDSDTASVNAGRYIGQDPDNNCDNWTSVINGYTGLTVAPGGPTSQPCGGTRPVACCF